MRSAKGIEDGKFSLANVKPLATDKDVCTNSPNGDQMSLILRPYDANISSQQLLVSKLERGFQYGSFENANIIHQNQREMLPYHPAPNVNTATSFTNPVKPSINLDDVDFLSPSGTIKSLFGVNLSTSSNADSSYYSVHRMGSTLLVDELFEQPISQQPISSYKDGMKHPQSNDQSLLKEEPWESLTLPCESNSSPTEFYTSPRMTSLIAERLFALLDYDSDDSKGETGLGFVDGTGTELFGCIYNDIIDSVGTNSDLIKNDTASTAVVEETDQNPPLNKRDASSVAQVGNTRILPNEKRNTYAEVLIRQNELVGPERHSAPEKLLPMVPKFCNSSSLGDIDSDHGADVDCISDVDWGSGPLRSRSESENTASADVPPGFMSAVPHFSQLIEWPFHELNIVVESNLPIYKVNEDHSLVTVRSLDMDMIPRERAVLNACCLDYYLDNVMANVPELALCLHSKGYLRGIHITQTPNLPGLTEDILNASMDNNFVSSASNKVGSRPLSAQAPSTGLFDPSVVDDNATTILRFLRDNCSREGATYILRKSGCCGELSAHSESNSQEFELYDLEALSTSKQTRWKWMLANVSYRFAMRLHEHVLKSTVSVQSKQKLRDRQRKLYGVCSELLLQIASQHVDAQPWNEGTSGGSMTANEHSLPTLGAHSPVPFSSVFTSNLQLMQCDIAERLFEVHITRVKDYYCNARSRIGSGRRPIESGDDERDDDCIVLQELEDALCCLDRGIDLVDCAMNHDIKLAINAASELCDGNREVCVSIVDRICNVIGKRVSVYLVHSFETVYFTCKEYLQLSNIAESLRAVCFIEKVIRIWLKLKEFVDVTFPGAVVRNGRDCYAVFKEIVVNSVVSKCHESGFFQNLCNIWRILGDIGQQISKEISGVSIEKCRESFEGVFSGLLKLCNSIVPASLRPQTPSYCCTMLASEVSIAAYLYDGAEGTVCPFPISILKDIYYLVASSISAEPHPKSLLRLVQECNYIRSNPRVNENDGILEEVDSVEEELYILCMFLSCHVLSSYYYYINEVNELKKLGEISILHNPSKLDGGKDQDSSPECVMGASIFKNSLILDYMALKSSSLFVNVRNDSNKTSPWVHGGNSNHSVCRYPNVNYHPELRETLRKVGDCCSRIAQNLMLFVGNNVEHLQSSVSDIPVDLLSLSYKLLTHSSLLFDICDDTINLSTIYCITCRLLRLCGNKLIPLSVSDSAVDSCSRDFADICGNQYRHGRCLNSKAKQHAALSQMLDICKTHDNYYREYPYLFNASLFSSNKYRDTNGIVACMFPAYSMGILGQLKSTRLVNDNAGVDGLNFLNAHGVVAEHWSRPNRDIAQHPKVRVQFVAYRTFILQMAVRYCEHAHSKLLPSATSAAASESEKPHKIVSKSIHCDQLTLSQHHFNAVWNVVSLELGHTYLSMGAMYKSELDLVIGTDAEVVVRNDCLKYFKNALSTFEQLERKSSNYAKHVALCNFNMGCTYLLLWRNQKRRLISCDSSVSLAQMSQERENALDFYLSAYKYYGRNDAGQTFLFLLVDLFDLYSGNISEDDPSIDQPDDSFIARSLYCLLDCRYVLTPSLVQQYDGLCVGSQSFPFSGSAKRTSERALFVKLINSVSIRLTKILFVVNKILNKTAFVEKSVDDDSLVTSMGMMRELYNVLLKKVVQFEKKSLSYIVHPLKLYDILVALLNNMLIKKWLGQYCYEEV